MTTINLATWADSGGQTLLNKTTPASLRAFINEAFTHITNFGDTLIFGVPSGHSTYDYDLGTDTSPLEAPLRGTIKCASGAWIDASNWSEAGAEGSPVIVAQGIFSNVTQLDQSAFNSTTNPTTITVPSTSGWGVGAYGHLISNKLFTKGEGTIGTHSSWFKVVAISDKTMTLESPALGEYTNDASLGGSNTGIYIMRVGSTLVRTKFQEMNIKGRPLVQQSSSNGRTGCVGISIRNGFDAEVSDCTFENCNKFPVQIATCKGTLVTRNDAVLANPSYHQMSVNGIIQYGIAIANGCEDCVISYNDITGGKEGICLTNAGNSGVMGRGFIQGVTRNCTIMWNTVSYCWRTGIGSHDNHEHIDTHDNTIWGCTSGMEIRYSNAHAYDNSISHTGVAAGTGGVSFPPGVDSGIMLTDSVADILLERNVMGNVYRGYWMPASKVHVDNPVGDITIRNGTITGDRCSFAVFIDVDPDDGGVNDTVNVNTLLGRLLIENCNFNLTTSGGPIGFWVKGHFSEVEVLRTALTGGAGVSACALIDGHSSGGTVYGPNNVTLDINYQAIRNINNQQVGFVSPVVRGCSGTFANATQSKVSPTMSTTTISIIEGRLATLEDARTFLSDYFSSFGSLAPGDTSSVLMTGTEYAAFQANDPILVGQVSPTSIGRNWVNNFAFSAIAEATGRVRVYCTNIGSSTLTPSGGSLYLTQYKNT